MSLRSKQVEVPGFDPVEFREPLFSEIESLLQDDPAKLGMAILKLCAYRDGKRVFDGQVGVAEGMALLKHVDSAMEVCGMADEKKGLAPASESSAD